MNSYIQKKNILSKRVALLKNYYLYDLTVVNGSFDKNKNHIQKKNSACLQSNNLFKKFLRDF